MSDQFDVIVIGGGPAGYPAAIRAAQLGLSVACIDDWKNTDGSQSFGGTCLNAGCIPSKALLESSELYDRAQHEFSAHGITLSGASFDLAQMQKRKNAIVKSSTLGILGLFKAAKVTPLPGHGRLLAGLRVLYTPLNGEPRELRASSIILASGSVPMSLPTVPFDRVQVLDSWDALDMSAVPKRLGVIGAGAIGLELGSVWRRLGSEVVVLEAQDGFLPLTDQQVAQEALKQFSKQGLDIRLGAKVSGAKTTKAGVALAYSDATGSHSVTVDRVVVAIGRRARTEDLLAADSGVSVSARGLIEVDDQCRTTVPSVYAVGDCVRGPMLAHKAKEEGVMVAELIAGHYGAVDYATVPSVIYTHPEIAWVGLTEEQVKASGRAYKVGVFPFMASGRARAMEAGSGFSKVISALDDDALLGVHIIGPMAGELIAEAVMALAYAASTEDLQRIMHAHPTLSEGLHEAALAADKRAIDYPNR